MIKVRASQGSFGVYMNEGSILMMVFALQAGRHRALGAVQSGQQLLLRDASGSA